MVGYSLVPVVITRPTKWFCNVRARRTANAFIRLAALRSAEMQRGAASRRDLHRARTSSTVRCI
jgi:hypothetical protein